MSGSSPYAHDKAAYFPERWRDLRAGKVPPPVHVQLILSDLCNHACGWCAYRMEGYTSNQHFADETGNNNPARFIPTSKAMEILDDCAAMGVEAIQFTGGGEPTVHSDLGIIMDRALSLGMSISLVTNGNILREDVLAALARATWVRVSLDAGTSSTYAEIRQTSSSHFLKALNNIERISIACPDVTLGVGFVVMPSNWLEIIDAAGLAKNRGADNFRVSAMFSPDDDEPYKQIAPQIRSLIARARALYEDDAFKIHDLFGDRLEDLHQHRPNYGRCSYQHFTTYIGGDQNVYRCCVTSYNDQGYLGSLETQGFRRLWESLDAELLQFDASSCERCQFNNKNRAMLPWWTNPLPKLGSPRDGHTAFV